MTDYPCHRGNVAYIFQSACEKRRPVTAMAAAAMKQKWFVGQQWRAKNCGKNKYGAAVHFPFRRPGALI